MANKRKNLYDNAHLVVAAIRLIENRDNAPPSIDAVSRMLSISIEQGNLICKKLKDRGIVDVVEGAFGTKLYLQDHLLIEEIKKEEPESSIESEVKKFQETQKMSTKKIQEIQAEKKKNKKDLFAEIERQFKQGLNKK